MLGQARASGIIGRLIVHVVERVESCETIRQAYAALEGRTIRQEVYGLDGSEDAPNPYQVGETSGHVRLVQPRGQNRYAVFYAYTRESLTYHYERDPADPRIGHDITLLVDEYGNVRRSLPVE